MYRALCQSALNEMRAYACWAVLAMMLALASPAVSVDAFVFGDANLKAAVVTGLEVSDLTDKIQIAWEPYCAGPSVTASMHRISRSTSPDGDKKVLSAWFTEASLEDSAVSPRGRYHDWIESRHVTEFSLPDEVWPVAPDITLTISSEGPGSVMDSGVYNCASGVPVTATPHASTRCVRWTTVGPVDVSEGVSAHTTVTVNGDGAVTASLGEATEFTPRPLSLLDILHVDDNALHDPGPNDLKVSDPDEDGSEAHPFDSIQEAIDAARNDVTVLVNQGRYRECLDFRGKSLDVNGFGPSHLALSEYPIVDAMNEGVVVTFNQGEDADCRLSGFVLTRGLGDRAGAISCIDSSPTIRHCLIVGNRCFGGQGVIHCENSRTRFEHCTIADNAGGEDGSGICVTDCNIVLSHSIVWGNAPAQIRVVSGPAPDVLNSCLDEDPLFALPGYWTEDKDTTRAPVAANDPRAVWLEGDYHVQSLHGRYDRFADAWAYDERTSHGIDLGDASLSVGHESAPHGDRVNAGAYGGSWMASRTGKLVFVAMSEPEFVGDMSKYEITHAQYCQYLNEALADQLITVFGHYVYEAWDKDHSRPYFKTSAASSHSQIIYTEGAFEVIAQTGYNLSHHPVTEVSWFGATAFGAYYGMRLPTSTEWQAAADYDGTYTYACGETIDQSQANYDAENPMGLPRIPHTSPVGYYPACGYGLCDMAGNVWEWTNSASGRFRLLHSGAWTSIDVFCTVASTSGFLPHYTLSNVGFRVCR